MLESGLSALFLLVSDLFASSILAVLVSKSFTIMILYICVIVISLLYQPY